MGAATKLAKLFLIRHGETVDNVAQVYAGSRDSALTNHGYQQATRLGLHFRDLGLKFTHIYSSHLQRAVKTAALLREAQAGLQQDHDRINTLEVIQLPILMEKDFGFYEGKKWYEKQPGSNISSVTQDDNKNANAFVDVEPEESMAQRADLFLDDHLLPLLNTLAESSNHTIAVVSHGIILSTLWRRLLLRLPPKSVVLSAELATNPRISLEHLGAWSNTGYLELHLESTTQGSTPALFTPEPSASLADVAVGIPERNQSDTQNVSLSNPGVSEGNDISVGIQSTALTAQSMLPKLAHEWTTVIQTVNGKDHLKGLKRTGGGVGSAPHDASQTSIEGFFKRRKIE